MNKLKTTTTIFLILISGITHWAFYDPYEFELTEEPPGEIQVIGNAGGERVFTMKKWKINSLQWEPGDYESISIEILIDCKSLTHDWKDLEKNIKKKKDYFYVKKFPTALVKINGATKMEENKYSAEMELTLKGVTRSVPLTFSVDDVENFKISGEGELNRRKFKFNGGGPENEVPLRFNMTLPTENI